MEEIEELRFEEVPTITDLYLFADLFLKAEKMDIAKKLYYTVYRRTSSRPALYRLLMLTIRMGDLEESWELYQAYEIISGMTLDTYELKYRLAKAEGASYEDLIEILEELKKNEYTEEWGYQLARLYELQGRREDCIAECDDLVLWFGSGKIVQKAVELKKRCLDPYWKKPNWENIPEPEVPEEEPEEEEVKVAYAPAQVMDIGTEEPVEEQPAAEPLIMEETLEEQQPIEEEPQEPEAPQEPEEVAEPQETAEAQPIEEEPVEEEPVEESSAEEQPESVQEAAEEPAETQEEPGEEEQDDPNENDETEQSEDEQPKKKGFFNRLIDYFKVDLDMFDEDEAFGEDEEEEELPEEADEDVASSEPEEKETESDHTENHESVEEMDAKAMVAREAQEIMETAAAKAETVTEEPQLSKQEAAVNRQATAQIESLEDQLEEMKGKRKVINLEDTMNLDKIRIKSHPLSGRPVEVDVCEDVSVNAITYCTLKSAIKKMPQEERTIHFALAGAAPGISLAVAKKLFKELKKNQYFEAKNIGKIQAQKLDEVDLDEWIEKFIGGCMYIENAPALSEDSVGKIRDIMEKYGKKIVIVLEGDYEKLDDFLGHHRNLEKQICYKIRL
ncbi:MAG TPA: hypothetical protein DEO89_04130 [Lachnospiraceae bacterium]|nr:hypothetical protein [Lachnospiraceae bacterium]